MRAAIEGGSFSKSHVSLFVHEHVNVKNLIQIRAERKVYGVKEYSSKVGLSLSEEQDLKYMIQIWDITGDVTLYLT